MVSSLVAKGGTIAMAMAPKAGEDPFYAASRTVQEVLPHEFNSFVKQPGVVFFEFSSAYCGPCKGLKKALSQVISGSNVLAGFMELEILVKSMPFGDFLKERADLHAGVKGSSAALPDGKYAVPILAVYRDGQFLGIAEGRSRKYLETLASELEKGASFQNAVAAAGSK